MRHISFMLTEPQIVAGTKTVTRRLKTNWKPGERRLAIFKGQGIPKGGTVRFLRNRHTGRRIVVECVSVTSEPLDLLLSNANYGRDEVNAEGFPLFTPQEFVEFFCKHAKCKPDQIVHRIKFKQVTSKV